jgi:hypothetical protein
MRVVTPERWEQLGQALTGFAVALADGRGRWADEQAVAEQLAAYQLTAGNFFQRFAEVARLEKPGR